MDADNTQETSQQTNQSGGKSKVEQELASVQEQLAAMNQQFQDGFKTLATAIKPPAPKEEEIESDDIYDPRKLTEKVLKRTDDVVSQALAKEREMNTTIYNLSKDYPEISSDTKLQKAIQDAHAAVPAGIRGTAAGYEMAVLKAVSNAGLVPKSKRSNESVEADISAGAGRGPSGERRRGKAAVTEKMLILADALGIDTKDKNRLKGLEDAANRDTYSRYR